MRVPSRLVAVAVAGSLSCSHWYGRGAMTVGGGAALGVGIGEITGTDDATVALVGASASLLLWGLGELVFATAGSSSGDDDGSGTYASGGDDAAGGGGDDSSASGGGDDAAAGGGDDAAGGGGGDDSSASGTSGTSGGTIVISAPDDDACRVQAVGWASDAVDETVLGDGQQVSAPANASRTTPLEACDAAKDLAFMDLRTRCGPIGGQHAALNQWIVYHQRCTCQYCPQGEVGDARASCSVTVSGVCNAGVTRVPEFGYAIEDSQAYATEVAYTNAALRCNGTVGEQQVIACDTEPADRGTETVTVYACAVSVVCTQ